MVRSGSSCCWAANLVNLRSPTLSSPSLACLSASARDLTPFMMNGFFCIRPLSRTSATPAACCAKLNLSLISLSEIYWVAPPLVLISNCRGSVSMFTMGSLVARFVAVFGYLSI